MAAATADNDGPFAEAAVYLRRLGLAPIPVGGDDDKTPLVKWKSLSVPFSAGTLADMGGRDFGAANVGIICKLSRLTIVDIDDPDLFPEMLDRFGPTPLRTGSPRGGAHLFYRFNGEPSTNLAAEGKAVDIKAAGGCILVPPSRRRKGEHAGKSYRFVLGSWDCLPDLPTINPGSMPVARRGRPPKPRPDGTGAMPVAPTGHGAVIEGARNSTLFHRLREAKAHCDCWESFLATAHGINGGFMPPLPDAEAVDTAWKVWNYKGGTPSPAAPSDWRPSQAQFDALIDDMDALRLLAELHRTHGARRNPFPVSSKAMAKAGVIPGWGRGRYTAAAARLVAAGFLRVTYPGGKGKGDARLFVMADPTADAAPILAGTF